MGLARRLSGQRGAAIVETIFVIIPLLLMMFGIVELARAWFTQQLATAAVREAARAGAVVAVQTDVSTVGLARMNSILQAGGIKAGNIIGPDVSLGDLPTGDKQVVATVTVRFETVFPVLLPMLKQLNIPQSAAMRWEFSGT